MNVPGSTVRKRCLLNKHRVTVGPFANGPMVR